MKASLEKTVASLVQKIERRFYGKYRAFVVDTEDPEQLGRIKVCVPSVLGPEIVTGWALPCVAHGGAINQGVLFVPDVDAGVWVEFEEGDLEFPIWVGTYWSKPEGESELPKPNGIDGTEEDIQEAPTRKIIKTAKGHTIQFEDKDDEEMLIVVQKVDEETSNVLLMNADGITITDSNENVVTMSADGISLADANGNILEMKSDAFNIVSAVPFTIDATGQPVEIKGDSIDLKKS